MSIPAGRSVMDILARAAHLITAPSIVLQMAAPAAAGVKGENLAALSAMKRHIKSRAFVWRAPKVSATIGLKIQSPEMQMALLFRTLAALA